MKNVVQCGGATATLLVGALGVLAGACVLPAPLGSFDTDTDTDGGSGGGSSGDPDGGGHSSAPGTAEGSTGEVPGAATAIDILFVFDNSGSMGEEQGALAASIDALVTQLEQVQGASYRIGITTTDVGNPWCGSTSPEAGHLQVSSCREHLEDFVFNGNTPQDATNTACLDVCELDSIPLTPTVTEFDPTPRVRPWIEGGAGGTNLDGVGLTEALRCAMPQGINGCGFESPLEAMYKALLRTSAAAEPSYGFTRSDAHLAIIFVTDETDCSYLDDSIFLPENMGGHPEIFWSDPLASAPSSAVCWNAGVTCSGSGDPYEECHAVDRAVDGSFTDDPHDAVLRPTADYIEFLSEVRAIKQSQGASVFLFGVVGVPVGYPAVPITYANSPDAQEQADFGIAAGCSSAWGRATPPVREREVIEAFGVEGMGPTLYSICEPPLANVYADIVGQLAPYLGG
ncbi:MAG: hypothetical protein K1X88_22655 [Nannocystaceae bacterium]|nr:hypothetical protein [Nannocystaceae bacterium]